MLLCIHTMFAAAPVTLSDGLTSDRAHAFERVYAEGRWVNGADGARNCLSGWSDVGNGQAVAAVKAVRKRRAPWR